MNSQSTKGFQSSENNAIIWTHVIMHLSKLIERMKQKGDCVIRVIMMCQRRLTSCNKRSILWGMLIIGEAVHVQGHGVCGKSLFLHLDFALKVKLFFKKKKKGLKKLNRILQICGTITVDFTFVLLEFQKKRKELPWWSSV